MADYIWSQSAVGKTVGVSREIKSSIFYRDGKPFMSWAGGCGIGHSRTQKQAETLCLAYLQGHIRGLRNDALKIISDADEYLKTLTQ